MLSLIIKIAIYALLMFHYKFYIVPYFSYAGFGWSFSIEKFLISIVLIGILSFAENSISLNKVSRHLISIMIIISIIPMLVLFSCQDLSLAFTLFVFVSVIIMIFLQKVRIPWSSIKLVSFVVSKRILVV